MRILIVDDEEEILNMLRRNLELEGFDVTTTPRPEEAISLMKENLFNMVLLDIKMPGMSGFDLLREFKRINPLANIIMMTAYSSMAHVVDCLGHGAMDYFIKPFQDIHMLLTTLQQARERVERWRSAISLNR